MQNKYNGWGLYNDPNDPRVIVPKMNPNFGWTFNIGHPTGRRALLIFFLSIVAAMAATFLLS